MKKLILIILNVFLFLKIIAQPPCTTTPGAATVVPVTSTICSGETVALMINNLPTGSDVIYKWQYSNISASGPYTGIAGANSFSYQTGPSTITLWYNAIITCANGGSATTTSPAKVVIDNCTGIDKQNNVLRDLKIYPNPVDRILTVEMPEAAGNIVFRIYSGEGRAVFFVYNEFKYGKTEIDLSNLETGMYVLEISSQKQKARKVICIVR